MVMMCDGVVEPEERFRGRGVDVCHDAADAVVAVAVGAGVEVLVKKRRFEWGILRNFDCARREGSLPKFKTFLKV